MGDKIEYDKILEHIPRWDLIPPVALRCAARVFSFGAKKYTAWGWAECSITDHMRAAIGHMQDFLDPNVSDTDGESNLPVLGHALARVMMAYTLWAGDDGELDDRFKGFRRPYPK